ncbi:MAG: DegV family protein [Cellulosilyticaceae bacterium]
MSFIIAADSNCDLSPQYIQQHHIHLFHILVQLDGNEIPDDLGITCSHQDFYSKLRQGSLPTTAQVNLLAFKEQFLLWAEAGTPVIYLAFSSGLSGTYQAACLARTEVLEVYPEADITIIDTLAASSGCGLLINYAVNMRTAGHSSKEVVDFIETTKDQLVHVFTVDDLGHLHRGGRLSASAALVGSLLQIKPLLYVDTEGHLAPYAKYRGRKKALRGLVDHFRDLATDSNQPVMISHGDALEDANFVASLLKDECGVTDITINYIGPAIGSHAGMNTIALFFIGAQKKPRV